MWSKESDKGDGTLKIHFTQSTLAKIAPRGKPYWINDDESNLRLYVGAGGSMVWYYDYRDASGKRGSRKIGGADSLTVAQAREMAQKLGGKIAQGENIRKEKPAEKLTLGSYLNGVYFRAANQNLKSADETIRKIKADFAKHFDKPIDELTPIMFEKWRTNRLEAGAKAATVNRTLSALRSALNWGVKSGLIESNPLQRLGKLKESDSRSIVRYLSEDERERLEAALISRERILQKKNGGEARGEFWDYLRPAVLVSLNTGIRRNTLFSLVWGDVDFSSQSLSLRGEISKNGKTARIPLNDDAYDIFSSWREQSEKRGDNDLIFPSPKTGGKLENARRSWEDVLRKAGIENFRWHDMRHDFASQLVMRGVDLTVVCELLNHSNLKLTMRYAHLAPKQKLDAVQALNRRPKGEKIIGRIRSAQGS
jgi:site-specific recombinase XerD